MRHTYHGRPCPLCPNGRCAFRDPAALRAGIGEPDYAERLSAAWGWPCTPAGKRLEAKLGRSAATHQEAVFHG
jgi:hypothetical protein